MDEEQSTKKWTKTKIALGGLTAAAATVLAVPLFWGAYVYGKTTELTFNMTKTAFKHPWMTAGIMAASLAYATHAKDINEHVASYVERAQHTYATYRVDSLAEKVSELEQRNEVLERHNQYLSTYTPTNNTPPKTPLETPPAPLEDATEKTHETMFRNKDFYIGLGAGGLLLGLGGLAYRGRHTRREKTNIRVVR